MRNKVKRKDMRRLTAVLLMMLMITGSFSVAAFAQEVPETEAGKTAEAAPAESAPTDEAQTPAADAAKTQAGSSQTESSTPEETQPAEETVQTTEGVQEEASQSAEAGDETVSAANNAAAVQSQAVSSEAKAAENGPHDVTFNFDKLPDGMSLNFKIGDRNYTYDGSVITDITDLDNYVIINDPVISVAAGSELIVQSVIGLEKNQDYQSVKYMGTKQLKLVLKDDSGKELRRLSMNNSTNMPTGLALNGVATAVVGIANRIKYSTSTDIYHAVMSTSIMNMNNLGQTESELGDIFAMEGDKISFDDKADDYERVDITLTDATGKSVAFSGGTFTMPSSMVHLNMIAYHKARTAKVTNNNPERGTLSISKSQYRPGDKVVVKIRSNSGYRFSTKTLAYLYMKDGKMTFQKITKDKDGKYSFIMPFYDIDISGVFVSKETADNSADTSEFIEYADAEDEEEEAAEELPEEEIQEMLDVTPLVSRIVAETVLTATVSVSSMTH